MRQSGRIAGVAPRLLGRLVAVPDRRDDDGAVAHGVGNGIGLQRRVAVVVRIEWIAEPAEAEIDHTCSRVHRPTNRPRLGFERNDAVRPDDLRDEQLRREREPGDAFAVVQSRDHQAGDERAVPSYVAQRAAADEALPAREAALELRMGAVDAGVDHCDPHPAQPGRPLRPGVEAADRRHVPLAREQRVVGRERELPARREPLDVGDPRKLGDTTSTGCRQPDGERPDHGCRTAGPGAQRGRERLRVRSGRHADGESRGVRSPRKGKRGPDEQHYEPTRHPVTTSVELVPATSPRPGAGMRAR